MNKKKEMMELIQEGIKLVQLGRTYHEVELIGDMMSLAIAKLKGDGYCTLEEALELVDKLYNECVRHDDNGFRTPTIKALGINSFVEYHE